MAVTIHSTSTLYVYRFHFLFPLSSLFIDVYVCYLWLLYFSSLFFSVLFCLVQRNDHSAVYLLYFPSISFSVYSIRQSSLVSRR